MLFLALHEFSEGEAWMGRLASRPRLAEGQNCYGPRPPNQENWRGIRLGKQRIKGRAARTVEESEVEDE
ncbi:hypothetical protein U9M48_024523 [Paspalum notatum var. saurae]|uniref:Uncharacterized protein n=1 Tax=Paspalum notatum var. saurae TaxID=547442 RepID=A0AAQ3WW12_PASNO